MGFDINKITDIDLLKVFDIDDETGEVKLKKDNGSILENDVLMGQVTDDITITTKPAVQAKEVAEVEEVVDTKKEDKKEENKVDAKIQKDFEKALEVELLNDKMTPKELQAFINEKATDPALKDKLTKTINKINSTNPLEYTKLFTKGKDSVQDILVAVYVKEENRKALDELISFMQLDNSKSLTQKHEKLKQGYYLDEKGIIRDSYYISKEDGKVYSTIDGKNEADFEKHQLVPTEQRGMNYYPYPASKNPYQKFAMGVFEDQLMPKMMDTKLRLVLKDLEEKGQLDNLSSESKIREKVLNGVSDPEFEKHIRESKTIKNIVKRHDKMMKRREELKHVSEKEIKNKLKNSTIKSIQGYMDTHKNADGTYDLSELSELIETRVGKDFLINGSKDLGAAEFERIKGWLVWNLNDKGLDTSKFDKVEKAEYVQTKDLADFCGFEKKEYDHTPRIVKNTQAIVNGIFSGVLADWLAPNVASVTLENHVNVNVTVTSHIAGAANVSVGVPITVDQLIPYTLDWAGNLLNSIGVTWAAMTVLTNLEDLIFGNPYQYEQTCFNTNDFDKEDSTYTNKNNYVAYLKLTKPNEYARIEHILRKYPITDTKTGAWDYDSFLNEARKIAGVGSNENCAELQGARLYPDKKPEKKPEVKPEPKGIVYSVPPTEEDIAKAETEYQTAVERNERDYTAYNTNSADWDTILGLYPCLVEQMGSKAKAKRAIAIIQGITDGNFDDIGRIKKLVDLSFEYQKANKAKRAEIEAELAQVPGYDWKIGWKHWQTYQAKRILPRSIAGCEGPEVITPDMLKTKVNYTKNLTDDEKKKVKAEASVVYKPESKVTIEKKEVPGYACGKYTDADGKSQEFTAPDEESARTIVHVKAGISEDKIPTAKDKQEFDDFDKKKEDEK